jgi:hypothetical protein
MSKYTITDEDFNRCIGSWLNANNSKYQTYVQGIKLFKEYLDELAEAEAKVTTAASPDLSHTELDKNANERPSKDIL